MTGFQCSWTDEIHPFTVACKMASYSALDFTFSTSVFPTCFPSERNNTFTAQYMQGELPAAFFLGCLLCIFSVIIPRRRVEVIKELDDALCSSASELKTHGNWCEGRVTATVSLAQGLKHTSVWNMCCEMGLLPFLVNWDLGRGKKQGWMYTCCWRKSWCCRSHPQKDVPEIQPRLCSLKR